MRIVGLVLLCVAALVFLFALSFGAEWLGLEWYGFFGKKRANIEREIHRNTDSFDEGMLQQLSRYRLEYMRSSDETEKSAIRSTVRTMFSKYPPDRLTSPELRAFLKECMNR